MAPPALPISTCCAPKAEAARTTAPISTIPMTFLASKKKEPSIAKDPHLLFPHLPGEGLQILTKV